MGINQKITFSSNQTEKMSKILYKNLINVKSWTHAYHPLINKLYLYNYKYANSLNFIEK